jgi:hypothetical protein
MVLIELFILKLALQGISQNINESAHEQELRQKEQHIKSQLSQLVIDYKTGAIDKDTYDKRESDILSKLGKTTRRYNI